jgi:hypothetical protein
MSPRGGKERRESAKASPPVKVKKVKGKKGAAAAADREVEDDRPTGEINLSRIGPSGVLIVTNLDFNSFF